MKHLLIFIAATLGAQTPPVAPKFIPFPEVLSLKLNALDKEKAAIRRPLEEAYELATRPQQLQEALLLRQACITAGAAIAPDEPLIQTDPSAAILTAGNCRVDMRRRTIAVTPPALATTPKSSEATRSEAPAKTPHQKEAKSH